MFLIDRLILLGATLLLAGIVSSKFSSRLGLPVLVLFLGIGMLAGEDGIGGLEFDNVGVAHAVGTLALAIILFDGGLQTRRSALEAVWKSALLLATVGVVVTAIMTGLAAATILNVSLLTGLLLGSIVASTLSSLCSVHRDCTFVSAYRAPSRSRAARTTRWPSS